MAIASKFTLENISVAIQIHLMITFYRDASNAVFEEKKCYIRMSVIINNIISYLNFSSVVHYDEYNQQYRGSTY